MRSGCKNYGSNETVRSQAQWRGKFFHLAMRRGRKIAKVAMVRKLAVHLMIRELRSLGYRVEAMGFSSMRAGFSTLRTELNELTVIQPLAPHPAHFPDRLWPTGVAPRTQSDHRGHCPS